MPLKEEVEKVVDDEEASHEIIGILDGFDYWYFDDEDYRQNFLPETGVDEPKGLIEVIGKLYDVHEREAAEDGEPFPAGTEKNAVIGRLGGLAVGWKKWWPDYIKANELENWLEVRGENAEIYEYGEYGDPEKSEGLGGLYVDENMPHADEDAVEELDVLGKGL